MSGASPRRGRHFGPLLLDSERRDERPPTANGSIAGGSARHLRSEVRFVTRAGVQSLNYRLGEPDQWLPPVWGALPASKYGTVAFSIVPQTVTTRIYKSALRANTAVL